MASALLRFADVHHIITSCMTCQQSPCTWPAPYVAFAAALGAPDSSWKTALFRVYLLQFLVLTPSAPGGGTLPGLLHHFRRFDAFAGLVAHWRLFGTSGHIQRPQGGVLQALTLDFVVSEATAGLSARMSCRACANDCRICCQHSSHAGIMVCMAAGVALCMAV